MTCRRTLALLFLALCAPTAASAHEFWLAPSRYHAAVGDSITVDAYVGTGFLGEARPFVERRAVRFLARGAAPLDLARGAVDGSLTWARLAAGDDGGMLVAYESEFASIELPAAEFEEYLRLEGLDAVVRARAAAGQAARPGRERYRRACKTWIAGSEPARAMLPLGLPLELVPSGEPGAEARLDLTVRFLGQPVAGVLVRAWRQPLGAAVRDSVGPRAEARSDAAGRVSLRLDGAGEWLVSAVHMAPARGREDADWESTWASLTFVRR